MAIDDIRGDFKQAMRRLAATIAIVTSGKGDGLNGMAATAVTSVTANPPTLLVAVNRSASLSPALAKHGTFYIKLLAERHASLVGIFSGAAKGLARFEMGNWQASPEGLPMLSDASASLICTTSKTVEVGTHTLFIGEVTHVVNHPDIVPLIWADGKFASARPFT